MAGCMRYCSSSSTLCTPASSRRLNSGTSRPSLYAVRHRGHIYVGLQGGYKKSGKNGAGTGAYRAATCRHPHLTACCESTVGGSCFWSPAAQNQ
jgi:hypothetical protein